MTSKPRLANHSGRGGACSDIASVAFTKATAKQPWKLKTEDARAIWHVTRVISYSIVVTFHMSSEPRPGAARTRWSLPTCSGDSLQKPPPPFGDAAVCGWQRSRRTETSVWTALLESSEDGKRSRVGCGRRFFALRCGHVGELQQRRLGSRSLAKRARRRRIKLTVTWAQPASFPQ